MMIICFALLRGPCKILSTVMQKVGMITFFDSLDYQEENVDSSNSWGTGSQGRYLTQAHTASTQYGTLVTRGAAFAADMLSSVETGENALANVAAQLSRKMNKDITAKVVSQLTGLFGTALSANSLNVSSGTPDASNYLNAQNVTQAKYLLGENANDVSVLVVHPLVAAQMEASGMLVFQNSGGTVEYASNGVGITNTQIGYFAGLKVIVDSAVPTVSTGVQGESLGYTCYLGAPGVIRTGAQFPLMIKQNDDILSLQDVMSVTYNRCDHVLGTSYSGTPHPENSDLANAANWSLAYGSAQSVPLVEMIVSTPYGAVAP